MASTTAPVQTTFMRYDRTLGVAAMEGRGFYYPVDLAVRADGRLYGLSRSHEGDPRGVRVCILDYEGGFHGVFGSIGEGDGQFIHATAIAVDSLNRVYVSDEHTQRISVFDEAGAFLGKWGAVGSGPGEIDGPSGLVFGPDDVLYLTDHQNHRVQTYTGDGAHLGGFGEHGDGDGQLDLPWGITVAPDGHVYVADWRNDRIQRFSPDGEFVASYGESGNGDGQLRRPASAAVDAEGYVYVADWGNDRVQVFDPGRRLRAEADGRGHRIHLGRRVPECERRRGRRPGQVGPGAGPGGQGMDAGRGAALHREAVLATHRRQARRPRQTVRRGPQQAPHPGLRARGIAAPPGQPVSRPTSDSAHVRPPLEGVRILAFEQFGAGPWATMQLADMGAEIVKIEDPRSGGDVARYVPPYTSDRDSLYFQSFNRNKKSVTLDLRRPGSKDVLHRLVRASDAVFNNIRGDLPSKLGLDYDALGPVKASIVCCSLSAFNRRGSRAHEPGYDYIMQAYAGWMSLTGEPGTPPQKAGLSMVDYSAGVLAALGMVSAILSARETGRGCDVDVNLFESALAHLAYLGAWHLTAGYEPRRWPDSSHPSQVPSQVLPTSDGWIVVMCAKEKFYRSLVRIMGAPELADDPRFGTFEARMENREALSAALKELSRTRATAEWLEALRGEVPVRAGQHGRAGRPRRSGDRGRNGPRDATPAARRGAAACKPDQGLQRNPAAPHRTGPRGAHRPGPPGLRRGPPRTRSPPGARTGSSNRSNGPVRKLT